MVNSVKNMLRLAQIPKVKSLLQIQDFEKSRANWQ